MNQWIINRLTGLVLILLGGYSLLYPPQLERLALIGKGMLAVGCLFTFFPLLVQGAKWIKDKFNAPYKPPRR